MNTGTTRIGQRLKNSENWFELLNGNIDAIQIKSFANLGECKEIVNFIINHPQTTNYKSAANIIRLGNSLNDILKTGDFSLDYSKSDILYETIEVNSVTCRLIGLIASTWPLGLETYLYLDTPLHRFIARRIINGGAEPHDDNISKELQDSVALTVQIQLGVNLYLEMPENGGELEGWNIKLNQETYNQLRNTDPEYRYSIKRDSIGKPDWVIKPDIGDLIIFQNSKLHAIRKSGGPRTTLGFFLGFIDYKKPFLIWS